MANKVGEVYLEIGARDNGLNSALSQAKMNANSLSSTFGSLGTMVKGFIGMKLASEFAQLAVSAYKTAAAWEQDAQAFEVMLGSAKEAKILLAQLAEFGKTTPLELKDLQTNAKLMLNFGIAVDEIMPNLKMLGDISGGDAQKLGQLTLAFSQMTSAGRLMGQDLLQMINAGFNPLEQISRDTGKSIGQLKKEMEAGSITTDMVKKAFKDATSEGGRFYGMLEKQGKTAAGLMSNVNDMMTQASVTMGNQLLPVVKIYLQDIIDGDDALQRMALGIGEIAGKSLLSFKIAGQAVTNWTSQLDAALYKMMFKLSEMQAKVGKAMGNEGMYRAGLAAANEYGNQWANATRSVLESQIDLNKSLNVWQKLGTKDHEDYLNQKLSAHKKTNAAMGEDTKKKKKEEEVTLFESVQTTLSVAGSITSGLGEVLSMAAANRTQAIENEANKHLDLLNTVYQAEKEKIENNVTDKKERDAQLKALDEKLAREEKLITEKLDKDKRKIAREAAKNNKAIATAETIISTASAAMGAASSLSKIPYVGWALAIAAAAAITALGATKIALIQSQPLPAAAEGGLVLSRPGGLGVTVAEAGRDEALLPLDTSVYRRMATGLLAALEEHVGGGQARPGATIAPSEESKTTELVRIAPMSREAFFNELFEASQNGELFIAKRGVQ